jgi:hypothetical protein
MITVAWFGDYVVRASSLSIRSNLNKLIVLELGEDSIVSTIPVFSYMRKCIHQTGCQSPFSS